MSKSVIYIGVSSDTWRANRLFKDDVAYVRKTLADRAIARAEAAEARADALQGELTAANEDAQALYQECEAARRFVCGVFGTEYNPDIPALTAHLARVKGGAA